MIESTEESQCVSGGGQWQQCGSGPTERVHNRQRKQIPGPPEIAPHICGPTVQTNSGERAGKKQREQEEGDSRELASQRRARRGVSARGQVRVW